MQNGYLHSPPPLGCFLSPNLKMLNNMSFLKKKPYCIFFYAEKYSLILPLDFCLKPSLYSKYLSLTSQSYNSFSINPFPSSENSK